MATSMPPPPPPPPPPPSQSTKLPGSPTMSKGVRRRAPLQSRLRERMPPMAATGGRVVDDDNEKKNSIPREEMVSLSSLASGGDWWISGAPILALVLCYGGTSSVLAGSLGLLVWHVLDLMGSSMASQALAVWWLTVLVLMFTVGMASDHALQHAFSLILLPITQMAWLLLVAFWGTLQYKWIEEDAPALACVMAQVLAGCTPLVSPALLTWGALASQLVPPSHAAFALACLCPLHTHAFATPHPGNPAVLRVRAGAQELKLACAFGVVAPLLMHVAVHFQLLFGPADGALAAFAAVAAAGRGGVLKGGSGGVEFLDEAQRVVAWELVILITGSVLGVLWVDGTTRQRNPAFEGLGLVKPAPQNPRAASFQDKHSDEDGDDNDRSTRDSRNRDGGGGRAFLSSSSSSSPPLLTEQRLRVAGSFLAAVLVLALERRFVLPWLAPWMAVTPWQGSVGLLAVLWLVLAGGVVWAYEVGGEDVSSTALQVLASVAAFLLSHLLGTDWLLRPMAVSGALTLCEFVVSKELLWYSVATGIAGFGLWLYVDGSLGFLADDERTALPCLQWLPLLGKRTNPLLLFEWSDGGWWSWWSGTYEPPSRWNTADNEGAPLGRLIVGLIVLAVVALMLPAMVWSQQPPRVIGTALALHSTGLALVEALLTSVTSGGGSSGKQHHSTADGGDAYPSLLVLTTAALHFLVARRLLALGKCPRWSVWFCGCVGAAKALTVGRLLEGLLEPKAMIPLALVLLALSAPALHRPRQHLRSRHSAAAGPDSSVQASSSFSSSSSSLPSSSSSSSPSSIWSRDDYLDSPPLTALSALVLSALSLVCLTLAASPVLTPLLALVASSLDPSQANAPSSLRVAAFATSLWASSALHLLARHFPHRNRLRRLALTLLAAACLVGWLDPTSSSATTSTTARGNASSSLFGSSVVASFFRQNGGGGAGGGGGGTGWALLVAALLTLAATSGLVPFSSGGASVRAGFGFLLGASVGVWATAAAFTASSSPAFDGSSHAATEGGAVVHLAWLQFSALGASVALVALRPAPHRLNHREARHRTSNGGGGVAWAGPLYCLAVCAGLASLCVSEFAPAPPSSVPAGHQQQHHGSAAAALYFSSVRLALVRLGATAHLATALMVRFATTSSSFVWSASSAPGGGSGGGGGGQPNAFGAVAKARRGSGGGGGGALSADEADVVCFVGNSSALLALALASAFHSLHHHGHHHPSSFAVLGGAGGGGGGGAQLTLWEVASWAPLTLLLLLLRDDGGLFSGLGTRNKYHPVLSALLGRLAWSPFHALFVRGAPFFVVTPSLAAAAKAAALAAKGAAGSAAFTSLGLDAVAAAKARAWRELSFWTAESLFTPALETTLLLALWPTLSLALEFLWLNQRTANATTNTVLLLAPLNLISLVLSRQLGTQLLGVAGLCLAMWQMTALSDLARRSQERI